MPERMTKEQRVDAIRAAAVAFANDYGPLAAANSGNKDATHLVATKLVSKLRENGLVIVQRAACP